MNKQASRNALIKQVHPALAHWGWHLVDAGDGWLQNGKKTRTHYVLDEHGDVVGHYFDLIALARDLRVLGERKIVNGYDMRQAVARCAMAAVEPADTDAAEVAAIMTLLGDSNPMAGGQVMKVDAGDHGLVDEEGRLWFSSSHVAKVPYTW